MKKKTTIPSQERLFQTGTLKAKLKVLNWKRISLMTLFCISLFLDFLGVFRITWFGQLLDDVFHRLLFGWLKYLYFSFIIFWYFNTITQKGLIAKYWPIINKKKLIWTLINLFWIITLIGLVIVNQNLNYSDYTYPNILKQHVANWKSGNVWEKGVRSGEEFFIWRGAFSTLNDGGGLIGLSLTGWTTYFHIIGAFVFNFVSWLFLILYFVFDHPFFLFLSSEQRQKYFWDRFNKNRINYFEPNTISKIDEKEVTIQIPIEKRTKEGKKDQNAPEETWNLDNDD